MNTRLVWLLLAAVGSGWTQAGSPAAPSAQEVNRQNANNICRMYFETPKPGEIGPFEQSRKEHNQFHKSQGDTWTWNVAEVQTGQYTGTYIVSTCNHSWKDFDAWEQKMGKADTQDANRTMTPHIAQNDSAFYRFRSDLSLGPANAPGAKMDSVAVYHLKPGTTDQFTSFIRAMNALIAAEPSRKKTGGWYELMNGGNVPEFVLVQPRQGWADMVPPDKTNRDLGVAAMGQQQYEEQLKKFNDSIASVWTEMTLNRPDLSYVPNR